MADAVAVPDLLRTADPNGVALRVGDRALTFAGWLAGAERVAGGLVDRGVQPGDRVALVLPNDRWLDYAACYMGTLMAGAVAAPLGTRFAGPELARVLADCGAAGVVGTAAGAGAAWSADPSVLVASPPAKGLVGPDPDDLAEIVYTSGTTGVPLGVACTHRSLLAHDVPAGAAAGGEPVTFLHAFPIGTQAGQEAMRAPLRVPGLTAVVLPTFDPEELCVLVERHRVRRLQLVPAMAQLLVASGAAGRHDVSSVRRIVLSSAPAAPALFERLAESFPGAVLGNAYALTEAGAARTLAEWDPARPMSVGPPVGATEVRIVDGEIWLRRPGTPARWFFNNPEATAAVFVDGWVRSGDLGHLDADGHLHLSGRAKDVVITGGANVSPVEVEHVLASHPAVVEAAVFGVAHPVLGEDLAAAVVVRQPIGERELQDLVRSQLAEHKVPHRIEFVDDLPHNPSGKVLKDELRRRLTFTPAPYVAPAGQTQSVVASVWEEVLDLPRIGADDDFLALGGHSLAAAQIAARLNDLFGADLGAGAVFERPTVKELAALLE